MAIGSFLASIFCFIFSIFSIWLYTYMKKRPYRYSNYDLMEEKGYIIIMFFLAIIFLIKSFNSEL